MTPLEILLTVYTVFLAGALLYGDRCSRQTIRFQQNRIAYLRRRLARFERARNGKGQFAADPKRDAVTADLRAVAERSREERTG